jgi:hypothetical protein
MEFGSNGNSAEVIKNELLLIHPGQGIGQASIGPGMDDIAVPARR